MAKFFGNIGFGESEETAPGVWQDVIVEKSYYGDVLRNTRALDSGDKVNNDLSVGNSISIIADPYTSNHFFAMRYIRWAGALWLISKVDASQHPRLILTLGGVYNGVSAPTPDPS